MGSGKGGIKKWEAVLKFESEINSTKA